MLPSNLTSLSLNFYRCMDLLERPSFSDLKSLTYLSLLQAPIVDPEPVLIVEVDLGQFPSSLQHLILTRSHTYRYKVEDLELLPEGLVTLHVPILSYYETFPQPTHFRLLGNHPPSLTHFCLETPSTGVEVQHLAPELRHIDLLGGQLLIGGSPIERLTSRQGPPIRKLLPKLHTLTLDRMLPCEWHAFETLPLSVTRFNCNYHVSPVNLPQCLQLGNQLNADHARETSHPEDRPGAPRMLRVLDVMPHPIFLLSNLLPIFPSVESILLPLPRTLSPEALPRTLKALDAEALIGRGSLLPPTLTSIDCVLLDLKLDHAESRDFEEMDPGSAKLRSKSLPLFPIGLVHLKTRSCLSSEVISLLPKFLERLEMSINGIDALEALNRHANERMSLPHLQSLSLNFDTSPHTHIVTLLEVPLAIRYLELEGRYQFLHAESSSNPSVLANHPNLTSLTLRQPMHPREIFPHLSKRLISVRMILSVPMDLNDPSMVDMLLSLPPYLHDVDIDLQKDPPAPFYQSRSIITSVLPTGVSSWKRILQGRTPTEKKLLFFRALPSPLMSKTLLYLVSEQFLFSCLPRTTSALTLSLTNSPDMFFAQGILTTLQSMALGWAVRDFWTIMTNALAPRLPLLALLSPRSYKKVRVEADTRDLAFQMVRVEALPRNISNIFPPSCELAIEHKRSLLPRDDRITKSQRWFLRMCFHSANVGSWILLRNFLRLDFQSHPLAWSFQWINLVGSTIAIPALTYSDFRELWEMFDWNKPFSLRISDIGVAAIATGCLGTLLWTTNYSAAAAIGYSGSNWSWPARLFAFGLAALGEFILHQLGGRLE